MALFSVITATVFSQHIADKDIKKNISPIDQPLQQVLLLKPTVFEYKPGQLNSLKLPVGDQYGFIAEEFQQVFPALVNKRSHSVMVGKNTYRNISTKTINMEGLIPLLVASIKEQQLQIEQLRSEIEALKKR
jgi:hypothetical protein